MLHLKWTVHIWCCRAHLKVSTVSNKREYFCISGHFSFWHLVNTSSHSIQVGLLITHVLALIKYFLFLTGPTWRLGIENVAAFWILVCSRRLTILFFKWRSTAIKVVDAELPVHITWVGVGRLPAVWIAHHTKSLTNHTDTQTHGTHSTNLHVYNFCTWYNMLHHRSANTPHVMC